MKEFIDKFAEKVMTTKESFDVKRDNGKAVTFVQRQCGDARYIYCFLGAKYYQVDEKPDFCAVVKDDQIYIIEEQIFFRNDTVKMWPDNVMHIDEYVNELNRKVGEEFKRFYDNLPVKDFAESAVQNMINDIRRDFLLPSKVKRENIRYDRRPSCNVKIDKEKAIEYLCGVIDYKKYTEKEFESVRNTLMISKSKRCKMQQLLEQGNIVTEDESKLALKLRSLKRSGQKIVEVQFTDSQDHLRGSARVKIEDLLYALVEREALLPSYCDRHDSGTCDFLERLEKFRQENNVKLYDIMTFDNITKIKSLLDEAILYKK